jgi:hypothetical protein
LGGLHVAVHQAAPVRRVQSTRNLGQDAERPARGERALAVEHALEVGALPEPHRQVELNVPFARLVDGDYVGVVKRRRQPRLAQEARPEPLVLSQLRRDQLQRHRPLERQIRRR